MRFIVNRSGDVYIHRSIVAAEREAQVANCDFIIAFGVRQIGIELEFLYFDTLEIESRNLAGLHEFASVVNDFGKGCFVFLGEIEQRLVQDHSVELTFQIVGQLPDDHLKLSPSHVRVCLRSLNSLAALAAELDRARDAVVISLFLDDWSTEIYRE